MIRSSGNALLVFTALCCSLLFSCKKNSDCTPASTANAGPDQIVSDVPVVLAANMPSTGKGVWSIVSGSGGAFSDINIPTPTFSGTAGTTYVLRWTISGCPISQDDVQIVVNTCVAPSTASAGVDQNVPFTTVTLSANTPSSGTATWSVVSGTGGNFSNVNSPTSTFTGVSGTTYVLRWTIAGCPSSSQDDVQIIFNTDPTATSIDKTSAIKGEIITITGVNFHVNYQGNSQIIARQSLASDVYLNIISVTSTQIKAVITHPIAFGKFDLIYFKRETSASAGVEYPMPIQVTLNGPGASQFYIGGFLSSSASKGGNQTIGVKNGSTTPSDYIVKLISEDYTTGTYQEYTVTVVSITSNGFTGGTMDALLFTVPSTIPTYGEYYCEVTYKTNATLVTSAFLDVN